MEEATNAASAVPPPEFVEATKDALDHLYDVSRLNHHRLARRLLPGRLPPGVSHAQALRQRLIEAIDRLNPGERLSSSSRQRRSYHLLELRYVEAMSFGEVMRTLALSQTQYHREQRHAIEMVAAYLWDTMPAAARADPGPRVGGPDDQPGPASGGDHAPYPRGVAARRGDDEVHLSTFLAEIVGLLGPIALQRQVRLRAVEAGRDPCDQGGHDVGNGHDVVVADRTALRNALIGALGFLLGRAPAGEITISAGRRAGGVQIDVTCGGLPWSEAVEDAQAEQLRWSRELMQEMGGTLLLRREANRGIVISLGLAMTRPALLVIDDNPDLVQLIARYLGDQDYAVLSAGSVEEGCATAQLAHPAVILLDVMMPHRDGWDALQLLRHHPATSGIPIVVCTVLAEDQLARALGATAFIRKPLTRPALLRALEETLASRPPPVAADPAAPAPRATSG